jgi:hypothetical protein
VKPPVSVRVFGVLDERGTSCERLSPSDLVVGRRDPLGQPVMDGDEFGPRRGVGKRDRDRHLTAQSGIVGLELVDLNHELAGHERDEPAAVGVGAAMRRTMCTSRICAGRSCLEAGPRWLPILPGLVSYVARVRADHACDETVGSPPVADRRPLAGMRGP